MVKTSQSRLTLWTAFWLLLAATFAYLLYLVAFLTLTPMMVYDLNPAVQKLDDKDISNLCRVVSQHTGKLAVFCAAAVLVWAAFSFFVLLIWTRSNTLGSIDDAESS